MQLVRARNAIPAALVVWCAALCGCGNSNEAQADKPVESTSEPKDVAEITATIVDRAEYDKVIARHKGKVVLVDFWATWCVPCMEQFPHTVAISKKYDAEKVAVVSVSMNEPDEQEGVEAFLKSKDASFEHLISKFGVGQQGFEAFELGDGGIPHYKIYDGSGRLRYTYNSYEELEGRIDELLNET